MSAKDASTRCDWLIGAAMATALLTLIVLFGDLGYAVNDDPAMLRPFMGFDRTEMPDFMMCLHPILVYPLRWLSFAVPRTAWFSIMQLAFIWLACAMSVKSVVGICARRGLNRAWGAAAGAAYLAVFCMTYSCKVTFTVTAAMLGGAAVLQVLSISLAAYSRRQVLRSLLMALVPVVLAYGLRQIAALPILGFCGIALLYVFMKELRLNKSAATAALKPACTFLVVSAVLFGVLIGGRELEIKLKGKEEYLHWQNASASVMDYHKVSDLPDSALESVGWTPAEREMVGLWYFMDENISIEAFEKLADYLHESDTRGTAERLNDAWEMLVSFREKEPVAWRSVIAALGLMGFCAVALLLRGRGSLWRWLCLILGALLALALLMYLGYEGRLPLRAALMAFLPFAALLAGLAPDCLPEKSDMNVIKRVMSAAAAACVLALALNYAIPAAQKLAKPISEEDTGNPFADLDEYASEYPEYLIIYDNTFVSDMRMFPSTEYGTPSNVMFWGGWPTHSDEYNQRLEAFGIDPEHMDVSIFLREDVRLARGVLDTEPDELYEYLCEKTGKDVYLTMDADWGGVHTFQFYVDE